MARGFGKKNDPLPNIGQGPQVMSSNATPGTDPEESLRSIRSRLDELTNTVGELVRVVGGSVEGATSSELSAPPAPSALDPDVRETARTLVLAERTAEQMTDLAGAEAAELIESARLQSEQMVADATRQAERLVADRDAASMAERRAWEERRRDIEAMLIDLEQRIDAGRATLDSVSALIHQTLHEPLISEASPATGSAGEQPPTDPAPRVDEPAPAAGAFPGAPPAPIPETAPYVGHAAQPDAVESTTPPAPSVGIAPGEPVPEDPVIDLRSAIDLTTAAGETKEPGQPTFTVGESSGGDASPAPPTPRESSAPAAGAATGSRATAGRPAGTSRRRRAFSGTHHRADQPLDGVLHVTHVVVGRVLTLHDMVHHGRNAAPPPPRRRGGPDRSHLVLVGIAGSGGLGE